MPKDLSHANAAVRLRNPELFAPPVAQALTKRKKGKPEADLQKQVIDDLENLGYRVVHFRAARTAEGWVTPVEGKHAAGYPDVTAVHPSGRAVVAELKAGANGLSNDQTEWLRAWMNVPGVTVLLIRPENWIELRSLL